MANVMDVAAGVQRAYGPHTLSWRKLHKLLYFCQGWALAWTGTPLFQDRIEAWREGPVAKKVYRIQKYYAQAAVHGSADALTPSESAIVDTVVKFYGQYKTKDLIDLSHRETPWRHARAGHGADDHGRTEITRSSIGEYFKKLAEESGKLPNGLSRTIDLLLSVPEDQIDRFAEVADVDFDAEIAYLRGKGPDPWPSASPSSVRSTK